MRKLPTTGPDPVRLRVATWNMNHWQQPLYPRDTRRAGWSHLRDRLGVDVALVQEAMPGPAEAQAVFREIAGYRNWGSGIVALRADLQLLEPIRSVRGPWSRRRHALDQAQPGTVAVARLTVPDIQPITLVSVYGLLDRSAIASMHQVLADLEALFDSPDGARVIVGGDFNVTRSSSDAAYTARAGAVFAAIEALGLVEAKGVARRPPVGTRPCDCGQPHTCSHVPTWGGAEFDHLYISASLAGQVAAVTLDDDGIESGLSDHSALLMDLELAHERTAQRWDEETFAIEVGRRHGPQARAVVEALVSWAEHRERALTLASGVPAKVLTRFPMNGVTTEPELSIVLDLRAEPRATQPMISIHAAGSVVVWFGSMRTAPFDSPEGRAELARELGELEGVDLPESAVDAWPRFPIELLVRGDNLARLVRLLDRVTEETRPTEGVVAATV